MPSKNNDNDEAMAAAMQEKYRLEFLQRQARKNASSRATAPPSDVDVMGPRPSGSREQMEAGPSEPTIFIPSDQERKDAALARKLAESCESEDADLRMAQQLQDEEMAYQMSQELERAPRSTTSTSNTSGCDFLQGVVEDNDMVLARQIAQEAEDADLARQYTTYEQEAASRQQASRRQGNTFYGRVAPLLCCAVAISIPLLFVFGVFNTDSVPGLDFNWDDFVDSDPYNGQTVNRTNPKAAASWDNSGKGLTLELLNALQDNWQNTFETAQANWDNGSPDALTLVTRRVTYDLDCKAVNNKLKVCNGNYGNNRWRGLNQMAIRGQTIFQSTAKMNEYYLTSTTDDARLYTMCHEIGHGFGLPHWDEDFYNRDLGNCMDYTSRPQDNKTPDYSNFQFLAELYGTKDGYVSPTPEDNTSTGTSTTAAGAATGGGTRGRLSRRVQVELEQEQAAPTVSDMEWQQLQPVYEQAMEEFYANHERRLQDTDASISTEEKAYIYSNSRLLYATDYLESHEIELSEDIVVQVHFLLA